MSAVIGIDSQVAGRHGQVAEMAVKWGEHVTAGSPLGSLIDRCGLHIEGRAFDQHADTPDEAANNGTPVTAIVQGSAG